MADKDNDDDKDYKLENEILIDEVPEINSIPNKKISKKKIIILIISIILILAIIGIITYFLVKKKQEDSQIPISEDNYFDPNEKIKIYTINKTDIKLGIISDFQLNDLYPDYDRNLKNTLNKIKEEKVDVIIIAGDIVDTGYPAEYGKYKKILNSIYTDNDSKPLIFEIMGNHEYYTTKYNISGYSLKKNIQLFKDNFNKYPFYHIKINNYHFIFWSMQNYDTRKRSQKRRRSHIPNYTHSSKKYRLWK